MQLEAKARSGIIRRHTIELQIESQYFDEAAQEARKRATALIDLLSYLVKISVLGFKGRDSKFVLVPWDRDRYFTAVSLGYQAYVRDLSEKMLKACLFDFRNLRGEPKLRISAADVVEYSPLPAIFEALSSASTDQSRRLSWAMHWLRHTRESPDPRDRLLDLWIAMEFLTAGTKTEEISNSSQLNAL